MSEPRIISNPDVMMGKPVIRGTRVTVELILRSLGSGITLDEMLEQYDFLTKEDLLAAQTYAADFLAQNRSVAAE